jgi:tetratricopeptide (TPR) repeat protein
MSRGKYIILILFLFTAICSNAQKAERNYIRRGNKSFNSKNYVKSEVNYRKALSVNKKSTISMYNLGNSLSQQKKLNDALKMYQEASKIEKDKSKLAMIYHNMGDLFMAGKDYENAIKAFSLSLLNNPTDDETRYNLALAKKLLKNQPKDKNKNKNNKDKNKQNKDKQKQNQDKQQNKKDQQKQQKQNQNQMSKQNADQMLNAAMQQERNTQDKMKKTQGMSGNKLEKNW